MTAARLAAAVCGLLAAAPAFGQGAVVPDAPDPNVVPFEVREVTVQEKLGDRVPASPLFRDHVGGVVKFGDLLDGTRPVLLTLNYSRCPKICDTQLRNLAETAAAMDLTPGDDYRLVTVSIDPREGPTVSASRRRGYLKLTGKGNWSFLTGPPPSINRLARAVGFRYKHDRVRDEYHHPPVAILLTPDGVVSRYLHGLSFDADTLRLSLVEASEGEIGTTADYFPMICYRYDPATGKYVPNVARMTMTAAGAVFTVLFGGTLAFFWRRHGRAPAAA